MDINNISTDFFKFVADHALDDTSSLLLKCHGKVNNLDLSFAMTQIECRRKAKNKLKKFIENERVLFPDSLSYEQSSHESVAAFHASLAKPSSRVLDMTAGLGIDAMAFADKCEFVTACESDESKAKILSYNSTTTGKENLKVINTDSTEWLKTNPAAYDVIFIDPARRDKNNGRTYNFKDCTPDITAIQDILTEHCKTLFIKASPLLDVTETMREIHYINAIRAISVNGECKEILIEASKRTDDHTGTPILAEAIDFCSDGSILSRFTYELNTMCKIPISHASEGDIQPGTYLFEPNAPIMKLAPWSEICSRFHSLKKLGKSTHLFIGPHLVSDFPGRKMKVISIADKKDRKALKGSPVNVVSRNYPITADELRKKMELKEGGNTFLYATRIGNRPILVIAERIN